MRAIISCLTALAACACAACSAPQARSAPRALRISAGQDRGIYFRLAIRLADAYSRQIPDLTATVSPAANSNAGIKALREGAADLAMGRADAVYGSYAAALPSDDIRAIAVIHKSVLHVVVRSNSRVTRISGLRGARIAYGVSALEGRAADRYNEILGSLNIPAHVSPAAMKSFEDAIQSLNDDTADVAMFLTGYPLAPLSVAAGAHPLRLLEIEPQMAQLIRSRHPFYKPTFVPAGTYAGQQHPVATIGVDNLLICRKSLDEELVYRLTRILLEGLPVLAQVNETAKQIDPGLAPTAPIPLHSGSARYYRERELLQ